MKRWQTNLLLAVLCIIVGLWLWRGYQWAGLGKSHGRSDLAVYYAAAQVMAGHTHLSAGDIYRKALFRPYVQSWNKLGGTYFLYPPQAALLFLPLGWFSFSTAISYWGILNSSLLIITILGWLHLFKLPLIRYSGWLFLLAVSPPTLSAIDTGQVNVIVFALLTVAWSGLLLKRYPWLIGISLGLATVIKIFPIIFYRI